MYILEAYYCFRVACEQSGFILLNGSFLCLRMNGLVFLLSNALCLFTCRWRASQLIKTIPASDLPQVRAKVAAMEMLKGQRADLGLQRAWEGNYLASVSAGELGGFTPAPLTNKEKGE